MFDVAVIGAGVIGAMIARELARYDLRVAVLEKEADAAAGASRANSGIVHAGFDAAEGSLKAKFNVEGNRLMAGVCEELGVEYKNNGSVVLAFGKEQEGTLHTLLRRGEANGVKGLKMLSREELFEREPNASRNATAALFAPTGGIV